MANIIEKLNQQPALKAVILELAENGRNETLPVAKRMQAYALVSDLMAPLMIEAAAESLVPKEDNKPKYRWVNGARIKVK